MNITAIILTFNEELHIKRAINSVSDVANRIVVVDSGSTDKTIEIAKSEGAEVTYNSWVNHATQFNWALSKLPDDTDWVLRLDADEFVTENLANEIRTKLAALPSNVSGVYVSRRMNFLGSRIEWGGLFPVPILRLFRNGKGRCENRWMDEHIIVDGSTVQFHSEIIDDNLNSLSWWTQKHNAYSSREVIDALNQEYAFMKYDSTSNLQAINQTTIKRWIKDNVYSRMPGGARAMGYFLYRYVLRLGFLDGTEGTAFHVLQGFWYRYLVDMKLREVRSHMRRCDVDVITAINDILGIDVVGNCE